jgi:Transcription factor WhiB
MGDTGWMEDARCVPDACWTEPDPSTPALRWMQQVCAQCPVVRECAEYALEMRLDGGVFAGVYVPARDGYNHSRRAVAVERARKRLRDLAKASA